MGHIWTWFSDGFGSPRVRVKMDDLKGLFQHK